MSRWQLGLLRYLHKYDVSVDNLRTLHQGTLYSLLNRGLIQRFRDYITLTEKGLEILEAFNSSAPLERKVEKDLSGRVSDLLTIVRRGESKSTGIT